LLTLFKRNPSEFWRLARSGFWNHLTKFFNELAGKTSARAYRLLYNESFPAPSAPGVAVLRDEEVFVVVTIYRGNVGIDGVVGTPIDVQRHLDKFPGAFAFVRRIDELKLSIMNVITSPQIYTSSQSNKRFLM